MAKYTKEFEVFWKLYPGRTRHGRIRKQDKLGAFVEWCKMTATEHKLAMTGHPEQGEFTPDARKWLKWKRWQDEDVTDKVRAERNRAQVMKQRNQHPDDTGWILEQTPDKLRALIKQWPQYAWRIKKVRPDIFVEGGDK